MCEIETMVNATGVIVKRTFDDLKVARLHFLKCNHSRKVGIVSVVCDTYEQYQYVVRGVLRNEIQKVQQSIRQNR